ncbi:hypothetical protein K438DRAFT_1849164 [Mycena galopus ATCC 62051]|nr:hypothetical protein K438DRAFT_1849164 [Mycena galopus ATCC 62051]
MHPGPPRRPRGPGKRGRALGVNVTASVQRLGKPGGALGEAVLESGPRQGPQRPQPPATKSVDSKTLPPLTSQRLRLRPSLDSLSPSRPLAVRCWCSNERQGRRRRRARSLVRVQRGRHQRRRGSFPHRWVHERQGEGHGAPFAASGSSVPGLSPTSPRVFTDTVPLISSPLAAAPQATRSAGGRSSRSTLCPPSSPPAGRPSSSTSPTSPRTLAVAVAVAASAEARMRTAADARPVGIPRRRTTGE